MIAEERPAPKIEEMIDEESVAVDDLSQTAVAPAQVRSVDKVDVGWVVQVGVFTDKKGAAKVVEDLKLKGFIPSTTIVDTNLGKETGTRVWLGPFAQRVDAAKSITSLKEKTGSDAFIRAYP